MSTNLPEEEEKDPGGVLLRSAELNDNKERFKTYAIGSYTAGLVASIPVYGKYITWLLTGTVATAALMIVNIDSITRHIPFEYYTGGLFTLAVSLSLGIWEKLLETWSTANQTAIKVTQEHEAEFVTKYKESVNNIIGMYKDVTASADPADHELTREETMEAIISALPWYIRRSVQKHTEFVLSYARGAFKKSVNHVWAIAMVALAQTVLGLIFILTMVFAVA